VTLAWYHGDRGQQRVTRTELSVLTLLLFLGGGLLWLYAHRSVPTTPGVATVQPALTSTPADSRPSIAVLPFENRSDEKQDAFFVDGIHDDILTQLSKVSALRVISRTSVERFRKTDLSVQQIAQQLGVKSILEGGVQRAGDRVRINVQLIDAQTDSHRWAENYDRELTAANIFAIQSEVASAIAGALKTALTPAEQARLQRVPTQDLEAWEAYQLGRQRMAKRTSTDLADAERFFRDAIGHDPDFALAYSGLADTMMLQRDYSGASLQATLSTAENAVIEALRLDLNLAEAWASSGLIAVNRSQFDRAESMYRRAIELNPNYAIVRHWYAVMLISQGRLEDALAQYQRAVELDPLSVVFRTNLGGTLEGLGRLPEAEATFRRAIEIDPSSPFPYMDFATLNAYSLDRFAAAVPLAQKSMALDFSTSTSGALAFLYYDLVEDAKFAELTLQASKRWPDDPSINLEMALVDLLRPDSAAAIRHAQRAYDQAPTLQVALSILAHSDVRNGRYGVALGRYRKAFPELMQAAPRFDGLNYGAAIDLALIAQQQGDDARAGELLDGAMRVIRTLQRLSFLGYGIADVQILALRGERNQALTKLREAEKASWRGPLWRYYRDNDLTLASIRNEPEFKAVFADIERDMARQRAALAARPKDAPLDLRATGT
jgi:TolB-like protein